MYSSSIFRNISYFRQSLRDIVANSGYFAKTICIIIFISYFLSFSEFAVEVLSVTPGYLLPPKFWLWTAFTHCFLEIRIWQVCVDIISLVLCGKLIEPLWGSFEMVFFFLLVNICVAFISACFYLILYIFTSNPELLFNVHIQGMAGYIAGLSVAVKQIMPDHVILHTHSLFGKITNQHVPLLLFVISSILYICHLLEGLYATMIGCGIGVSWVYLRFYQVHSNGSRGDLADSFKFSSFFPNILQPFIQHIANWIFTCFVKMRLCRRAVRRYDVGAPTSISISLPGMDPADAERRRQKALKLLSHRLNQDQMDTSASWPSVDEFSTDSPKYSEEQSLLVHAPAVQVQSSSDTFPPLPSQHITVDSESKETTSPIVEAVASVSPAESANLVDLDTSTGQSSLNTKS